MNPDEQRKSVTTYYGETLKSSSDLKTSACCPVDAVPSHQTSILQKLHPEVTSRFYGCGTPIPDLLTGCVVLDLGCGTGRDVYLSSALVGVNGRVIGVDMTEEQIAIAERHKSFHARAFFGDDATSNVEFRKGVIEDLRTAGIADDSVDVVISNCVCNLSPDKKAVFAEVARVLKPGGEFYFSDLYANRRLTHEVRTNEVLIGEGLGGALYIQDFRRIMAEVGFADLRVVTGAPVVVYDPDLKLRVPDVSYFSLTIRAFSLPGLEDGREDYGQTATYRSCSGESMKLDVDYSFKKDVAVPVDANTATILTSSRFKECFTVTGRGVHKGVFEMQGRTASVGPIIDCFRPRGGTGCPAVESQESGGCGPAVQNDIAVQPETNGCGSREGCC